LSSISAVGVCSYLITWIEEVKLLKLLLELRFELPKLFRVEGASESFI